MMFELDSPVVELCARGMETGGKEGDALFAEAWEQATTDIEKAIAAHYVARSQQSAADKLSWDETALAHALEADQSLIGGFYPSLHLNIAKGYEDLGQTETAMAHYLAASRHAAQLPDDGYSNLIRGGIQNGIERLRLRS